MISSQRNGPYAQNLRHVLDDIEGRFVTGYADGGDEPIKPLELLPGAVEEAGEYLLAHPDTLARSEQVSELFKGFETPRGMELLATVHWLGTRGAHAVLVQQLVERTHAWNERKQQFSADQVAIAADALISKGRLTPYAQEV